MIMPTEQKIVGDSRRMSNARLVRWFGLKVLTSLITVLFFCSLLLRRDHCTNIFLAPDNMSSLLLERSNLKAHLSCPGLPLISEFEYEW